MQSNIIINEDVITDDLLVKDNIFSSAMLRLYCKLSSGCLISYMLIQLSSCPLYAHCATVRISANIHDWPTWIIKPVCTHYIL